MNSPLPSDDLEKRLAPLLLDVLTRAALIGILALLCYQVFAPFLTLMVWALILAVTIYPLQQWIARRTRRRQGLAATIVVIIGGLLNNTPSPLLLNSFGSSIHDFVHAVQSNTLEIRAPRERIKELPIVGEKMFDVWSRAHTDLPG